MIKYIVLILLIIEIFLTQKVIAQELLSDTNGDGQISIVAFGDSITYGVGDGGLSDDGVGRERGYPTKLESLLKVGVYNEGVPGEISSQGGVSRFINLLRQSSSDLFIILEGTNDANELTSGEVYQSTIQKMVNAARIYGKKVAVLTLITPCCEHSGLSIYTQSYSSKLHEIALTNDIKLIDIERAWKNSCVNKEECELYNLPEGLHPTSVGYTVLTQTIAAGLLDIDIFSTDGTSQLEDALGLSPGDVIVKP